MTALEDLENADDCISHGDFIGALSILKVKHPTPVRIPIGGIFNQIIYEGLYKPSAPNPKTLAIAYLTFRSNWENVDTLLINTKTSNNPKQSLSYKYKSEILSEVCEKINRFYNMFPNLKDITDDLGDEIDTWRKNKPSKSTPFLKKVEQKIVR